MRNQLEPLDKGSSVKGLDVCIKANTISGMIKQKKKQCQL